MKYIFLPLFLVSLTKFSSALITIDTASDARIPSNLVVSNAAGSPTSGIVRVGFFNSGVTTTQLKTLNYNELNSLFIPLGEGGGTPAGSGVVQAGSSRTIGSDGRYALTIENVTNTYAPVGTQLYLWFLNNPTTPSASTEWALVTNDEAPTWTVPEDDPDAGVASFLTLANNRINDSSDVIIGSLFGPEGATAPTQLRLALAPIPEPTTLASLLLGGLALMRRRRVK